jgi:hypothetical protein
LCGKRDGILLTLHGYSEYLEIDYKITDIKDGEGLYEVKKVGLG